MHKQKITKNIVYSSVNYIVVYALRFISRIVFINTLPIEYLGINGLFSNILSVLSLVELGIGPAIIFSLYKPLALKDTETIKSIMRFYKKAYTCIGTIVFGLGFILYPFLDYFIKGNHGIPELHYFYLVYVANAGISYFGAYKRNLLIADQKYYEFNIIQMYVHTAVTFCQIALLVFTKNYWSFVLLMLAGTIFENLLSARQADKEYPYLAERAADLVPSIKNEIIKNTKAMLAHKIGGIVFFSSSNLIISKFVGLAAVGIYSNYCIVTNTINYLTSKLAGTITASIGHMIVTDTDEQKIKIFKVTQFFASFQFSLITVGFYVLINPFVELWVGSAYLFNKATVAAFVFSFYLTCMRKNVLMFHDACGLFWYDRYKPLAESVINLIASVYLAKEYGIVGVLYGNIISTMLTCFWIEPYVLFRYGIKYPLTSYYKDYFEYTGLTALTALALDQLYTIFIPVNNVLTFIACMLAIIVLVALFWSLVFYNREEYRDIKSSIVGKLKGFFIYKK